MNTDSTNTQIAGFRSAFSPYMQQAQSMLNLRDLPEGDKLFGTIAASNLATQLMNQDPAYHQRLISMYEPIFQQRGETAMKYGIISNAVGSLLKDVPAAFREAQQARFAYDPERFEALRRLGTPPAGTRYFT